MDDLFHLLTDDVPNTHAVRLFYDCTYRQRNEFTGLTTAWWARVRRGSAYAYVQSGQGGRGDASHRVTWSHPGLLTHYPGYLFVMADAYDQEGVTALNAYPRVHPSRRPPDPRDLIEPLVLRPMLRRTFTVPTEGRRTTV